MVVKAVRWGEIDLPFRDDPTERHAWHGRLISLDGCKDEDFSEGDIVRVLHHFVDDQGYDGEEVGVVQLSDGRYACWETWWGPTGSGFSGDAYGGGVDIHFARDLDYLLRMGLTDEGRTNLAITL